MHLTQRQIEGYARRDLPPADLLAADDHLAECAECRLAVAERLDLRPPLAAWEELAEGEGRTEVERVPAPPLAPTAPPPRRWPRVLAWAACLAFAAALAAWLLLGRSRGEREEASAPPAPGRGGPSRPAPDRVSSGGELPAPPEEAQGVSPERPGLSGGGGGEVLVDGARRLRLVPPGRLAGLDGVPADWGRLVRESWAAGRLETPGLLAELRSGSEVLRGGGEPRGLSPLEPVGVVVRSAAPTFRWSPLPGGDSYRVRVYDLDFRVVAESPLLEAARGGAGAPVEWTPAAPLARGAVYTWQVSARRGGEELTAPDAARGEARFQVLPSAALREIESAEALQPPSRLLLAALYARSGLLPAAERELGRLAGENPGSEAVRRLRASLRAGS